MNELDIILLEDNGWEIECELPLELRNEDGSIATGQAALAVVEILHQLEVEDMDDDVLDLFEEMRADVALIKNHLGIVDVE